MAQTVIPMDRVVDEVQNDVRENSDKRGGDHTVKRVLDHVVHPRPEEMARGPKQVRNNKERAKNQPNTDRPETEHGDGEQAALNGGHIQADPEVDEDGGN